MSTQSMKYSDLPTIRQLMEFKRGTLSNRERAYVAGVMEKNPMVAAVIDDIEEDQIPAIEKMSARIKKAKLSSYLNQTPFWLKFSGWLGLSAVMILTAFYFWNASIQPEQRYEKVLLGLESSNKPERTKMTWNLTSDEKAKEKPSTEVENKNVATIDTTSLNSKELSVEEKELGEVTEVRVDVPESQVPPLPDKEEKVDAMSESNDIDKESKNEVLNTAKNKKSTILLTVNQVQILSKVNPKALKTKQRDNDRNPLGTQTTTKSRQFSVKDMPKYPGGDRALKNYFIGQLQPIEIDRSTDKYDRSVLVELTINRWGKVKNSEIRGELHPTHQEALDEAIESLPRFKKGSEKVHYSIGISF